MDHSAWQRRVALSPRVDMRFLEMVSRVEHVSDILFTYQQSCVWLKIGKFKAV